MSVDQQAGWTPRALARGAVATVDLDALRHNLRTVRERVGTDVMAVVKADAYGHGLVECARAAQQAGATWLGVALPSEAVRLRDAGVQGRVLTWLETPGAPFDDCVDRGIDVTVSAPWALDAVRAAAKRLGTTARVQLKLDSGLSRNGSTMADWPALVAAARDAELEGRIAVTGVWTHFACADEPEHPSVRRQLDQFEEALGIADVAGLRPEVRHAANSAAALAVPAARYDVVRIGIAMYGLSPGAGIGGGHELGLRPVMALRARLASVKRVPGGSGVSYGHLYTTARETTLGVVPLGYADGIPRSASNLGPLLAAGAVRSVAGRVCMDQVVIDLGDDEAAVGDEVVLFGADGPSADDWAAVCGTIGYEIVTRIGPRVPREHLGVSEQ
ncbi:MAG: alanine racemase [Candidatus Nanopelagicales bacterium]